MSDAEWLLEEARCLEHGLHRTTLKYEIVARLRAIASRLTPPEPSVEELRAACESVLKEYGKSVAIYNLDDPDFHRSIAQLAAKLKGEG